MLTVIVAFGIPLALSFERRVVAEAQGRSLAQAQAIASAVGDPREDEDEIPRVIADAARVIGGRVTVVDAAGAVVADSSGTPPGDAATEVLRALGSRAPVSEVRRGEGPEVVGTSVPIVEEGEVVGAVGIEVPLDRVRAGLPRTYLALGVVGSAALLAGLAIAFALAGSFARPLRRLAASAARLGRGDLGVRTGEVRAPREIREVATSFDEMAERLQATVRAQRRFAGNASHQLRTPLTALKLRIEAALAGAPEDLRPELAAADHEVDRLTAIVERLLVLSRRVERTGPWESSLGDLAAAAVDRWRARLAQARRPINATGDDARAAANPADVEQILDNLIENALVHGGGAVTIETRAAGARAMLAVEDRGRGIRDEEAARVLERFYRGSEAPAGGSGLGLAIVRDLAERWEGEVRVGPGPGGGARVEIELPAPPPTRAR